MMSRPRGGDWLEDEIKSLGTQKVDVIVSLLTQEEVLELELTAEGELCAQNEQLVWVHKFAEWHTKDPQ